MKKFTTLVLAGSFLFSCGESAEPKSNEDELIEQVSQEEETTKIIQEVEGYTHYGIEKVAMESSSDISTFATELANNNTESCTVKAPLSSICAKAGCFVIVDMPDSSNMRVMFKDHFTIPPTTPAGTEAIFTGTAKMDTTSVADLQHYIMDEMEGENVSAEKKAELQAKHDAITEPTFEPIFIATGILVKN
ncbi:MAG: DUF4920 domain-containing protein [Flavobacteriales bacterium]